MGYGDNNVVGKKRFDVGYIFRIKLKVFFERIYVSVREKVG